MNRNTWLAATLVVLSSACGDDAAPRDNNDTNDLTDAGDASTGDVTEADADAPDVGFDSAGDADVNTRDTDGDTAADAEDDVNVRDAADAADTADVSEGIGPEGECEISQMLPSQFEVGDALDIQVELVCVPDASGEKRRKTSFALLLDGAASEPAECGDEEDWEEVESPDLGRRVFRMRCVLDVPFENDDIGRTHVRLLRDGEPAGVSSFGVALASDSVGDLGSPVASRLVLPEGVDSPADIEVLEFVEGPGSGSIIGIAAGVVFALGTADDGSVSVPMGSATLTSWTMPTGFPVAGGHSVVHDGGVTWFGSVGLDGGQLVAEVVPVVDGRIRATIPLTTAPDYTVATLHSATWVRASKDFESGLGVMVVSEGVHGEGDPGLYVSYHFNGVDPLMQRLRWPAESDAGLDDASRTLRLAPMSVTEGLAPNFEGVALWVSYPDSVEGPSLASFTITPEGALEPNTVVQTDTLFADLDVRPIPGDEGGFMMTVLPSLDGELLAHELAHTAQQRGGPGTNPVFQESGMGGETPLFEGSAPPPPPPLGGAERLTSPFEFETDPDGNTTSVLIPTFVNVPVGGTSISGPAIVVHRVDADGSLQAGKLSGDGGFLLNQAGATSSAAHGCCYVRKRPGRVALSTGSTGALYVVDVPRGAESAGLVQPLASTAVATEVPLEVGCGIDNQTVEPVLLLNDAAIPLEIPSSHRLSGCVGDVDSEGNAYALLTVLRIEDGATVIGMMAVSEDHTGVGPIQWLAPERPLFDGTMMIGAEGTAVIAGRDPDRGFGTSSDFQIDSNRVAEGDGGSIDDPATMTVSATLEFPMVESPIDCWPMDVRPGALMPTTFDDAAYRSSRPSEGARAPLWDAPNERLKDAFTWLRPSDSACGVELVVGDASSSRVVSTSDSDACVGLAVPMATGRFGAGFGPLVYVIGDVESPGSLGLLAGDEIQTVVEDVQVDGPGCGAPNVSTADLNGDGYTDLVLRPRNPRWTHVVLSHGRGRMAASPIDMPGLDATDGFTTVAPGFAAASFEMGSEGARVQRQRRLAP